MKRENFDEKLRIKSNFFNELFNRRMMVSFLANFIDYSKETCYIYIIIIIIIKRSILLGSIDIELLSDRQISNSSIIRFFLHRGKYTIICGIIRSFGYSTVRF